MKITLELTDEQIAGMEHARVKERSEIADTNEYIADRFASLTDGWVRDMKASSREDVIRKIKQLDEAALADIAVAVDAAVAAKPAEIAPVEGKI